MMHICSAVPRKWTETEIKTLKHLYCYTSYTTPEIAKMMDRTPGSVGAKISMMNLANERPSK